MKLYFRQTLLGRVGIAEQGGYITAVCFDGYGVPPAVKAVNIAETALISEAFSQLDAYLAGGRAEFSLPLAPQGTLFRQSVWKALCTVPYGTTASYKDIALAIGNPRAARAVGQANNKNPLPIFIPCHRIIGANGDLVGYGGGLEIKVFLLALEKQYRAK
jgi:methylated-DNA-[protein]-cysteine S-methyltransferase